MSNKKGKGEKTFAAMNPERQCDCHDGSPNCKDGCPNNCACQANKAIKPRDPKRQPPIRH